MKIISKKITKFGKMGKIPMSAAARIYHQDSDEDDSSASSESVNSEINEHVENKHASPIFEKGLHYQPVFKKVVESSEKNLTKLIDLHQVNEADDEEQSPLKIPDDNSSL